MIRRSVVEPLPFLASQKAKRAGLTHRNNRHRMRAPIFSQSKICLHKMAHSKGHFYSVQTPAVKNFARSRGVRLLFSNTVFLRSLIKKISLSKIHPSGFFKKRISFGRKIYSKIQRQGCCEGKTKLKGYNKTQNKTARYVFTVL